MSSTPLPTNIHPHARELISDSLSADQTFTNINVWSDQNNQRLIRSQFNALSQSSPPPWVRTFTRCAAMRMCAHSLCLAAYRCSLFDVRRFERLPDSNKLPTPVPTSVVGTPTPRGEKPRRQPHECAVCSFAEKAKGSITLRRQNWDHGSLGRFEIIPIPLKAHWPKTTERLPCQ